MHAAAAAIALAVLATPAPEQGTNDAVRNGLKWLAAQQKDDGTWEGLNGVSPTTITTMAGLALLMEGSTPKHGAYAPHVRKTVAWLEANTSDKGLLASNSPNEMYQYIQSHAHALQFLACAYDADDDTDRRKRLVNVLDKATAFLTERQHASGGWGIVATSENGGYSDSQSTALALQALLAARKVGISVPKTVTDKGFQYLARATNKEGGIVYSIANGMLPAGNDGQPMFSAMAAAGVLMQDGGRPESLTKWVQNANSTNATQQLRFLRDGGVYAMLQQYQFARVAFALGENGHRKIDADTGAQNLLRWSTTRPKLFKELKNMQAKDGSWADANFGPNYCTAVALVILQLDNDYLPALAR
ncbi:terpene cyclase/mutase family protein [Gemmata sp. G18]|uniref:Terpene cyclase/mutase family protein n=1 Tax=Gemmata palustris TaxID=2822762 RepID=A0ABS5BSI3_9BACT|nr:prenyltransferase/squalene oxidase repeat-containing protein [Gemmata palustris]MBP3956606.1 terpene cyclase/mutase family protein [Gemmata palustris]